MTPSITDLALTGGLQISTRPELDWRLMYSSKYTGYLTCCALNTVLSSITSLLLECCFELQPIEYEIPLSKYPKLIEFQAFV